ncbi:aldehyde dehydrogenase family protein [Halioglobus maricola]|uniref:Aldehyde dehydrogenase family protein n=1 Tax=Halioglobus maricola TaxID=2601894 RepID=A0A5P9NMJ4_9GAMM|nr:aldehyde dehydrogenase family protein [Halioglobus maricola]QFU76484.1 aldehyde dehydrogenase family protein [Halioglobus maricola]
MQQYDLIIGGETVAPASGEYFEVFAPATESVMALVARASAADAEKAVACARRGFNTWAALAPREREACLLRAADIIAAEGQQRFLENLIDESGSVIAKARGEIAYSVDLLRTAAGEARRLYGDTFPNDSPDRMSMVFREPMGVVAVISPYNAPLSLLTKMAAFPIAAGNAVVIKPSEETPLTALALGQVLLDAGMPADAVSVVTGFGAECGAPLVDSPDVDCIALTGSTNTGVAIGAESMKHMRRCQLELGGKSALLVLRDADPKRAAEVAAQGIFTHAGQICMANSRIVVERDIYDDFVAALKANCEAIKLGDLRADDTRYGPLINRASLEKVQSHIRGALDAGATLLTGGEVVQGLVLQPTVVLNPARDTAIWREESFGPLASIVAVDNLEEAIDVANDSDFGLSAAVLTHNVQWGFKAARSIRAGSVHIGMHAFQSNALAPIGGHGMSGIGRSGGKYSTEEFTELKWISLSLEDQ